MANRDLVVAVFAEGAQFRQFMEEGGPRATKVFSYAVEDMAKKNIASMTAQQAKLRELQAEYARVMSTAKAGSAEFSATSALLAKTNRQLGESSMTMGRALDNISRKSIIAGKNLTTYITVPMLAAAGYSAKLFIDFQRRMEMIHTQAGAPQSEVTRMTPAVLNLAQTSSPEGPTQLAEGLYYLESRGVRGKQALDALKTSADAAGMGLASVEDVTNALGGALVTGIKGFKTMDQAMGIISATVGNGAMHMADYAAALRTGVVPAGKAAGITLQEIGAALDVLTDRGMPAQMAATRLRMTFSMMESPTKAATKALGELGIGHYQLAHDLQQPNGLLKALVTLQEAIDKSKDKTKAYDLVLQAFGKGRSSAGILTMLNSLTSSTSSFQGKLALIQEQEHNFALEVAAYHQTASYKISHAWASVQASLTKLGGALAPSLTIIAQKIADLAKWFQNLPPNVQKTVGVIAILTGTLGPVLLIFGKIVQTTIMLGGVVKGLAGIFATTAASSEGSLAGVAASEAAVGTTATAAGGEVTASATVQKIAWESVQGAMVPVITEEELIGTTAEQQVAKVSGLRAALLGLGDATVLSSLGALGVAIGAAYWGGSIDGNNRYRENPNAKNFLGHAKHNDKGGGFTIEVNKDTSLTFGADGKISENYQHGAIYGTKDVTLDQAAKELGVSAQKLATALSGGGGSGSNGGAAGNFGAGNISNLRLKGSGKAKMLAFAAEALGTPYVWGGSGLNGFDCSGLVMWAFENGLNVSLPHSTYDQVKMGRQTAEGQGNKTFAGGVHVGDVVFTNYGEGGKSGPGHEGLIVGFDAKGNPIVESAPHTGSRVHTGSLSDFSGGGYWSARNLLEAPLKNDGNLTWQQLMKKYGDLTGTPTNPDAVAANNKKIRAAIKAAHAAAKSIIDPITTTVKTLHTDISAAIKSGDSFSTIKSDVRKEVSTLSSDISLLQTKLKTANQYERPLLQNEINKLVNARKSAAAELQHEINAEGLAIAKKQTEGMLSHFHQVTANYNAIQALAQFGKIPGVKTNFATVLNGEIKDEVKVATDDIAKVTRDLKSARGPARTALQSTLTKLKNQKATLLGEIEKSLEDQVSQMQQAYDTAKTNFENVYQVLTAEIDKQFQDQTQAYIDNILGSQFFQNGALTPAEQALKDFQDKRSAAQLQRSLTDSYTNLLNDLSNGVDLQGLQSDAQSIQDAKDAITEADLQKKATQERIDADKAYAQAVKDYTSLRDVEERQLNEQMSALGTSIENGTGTLSQLDGIMSKYGVTVDGTLKQVYGQDYAAVSQAIIGKGGLVDATYNLQSAFYALVDWINKTTGSNISVATSGGNGQGAPPPGVVPTGGSTETPGTNIEGSVGTNWYDVGGWMVVPQKVPKFATGGIVSTPTLAMVGEAGPEAVIPLNRMSGSGGGDLHIHFDGPVIGTGLDRAARELTPVIRAELIKLQRRNAGTGFLNVN